MQLTGTIEERVGAAVAFAKAHRTKEYDHERYAAVYRKAGVPYTKAAENFCREWCGVLEDCALYDSGGSVIDFDFRLLSDVSFGGEPPERTLEMEYTPEETPRKGGFGYPDFAAEIRSRYGADTVPVATGGYYYPSTIFVRPDGGIVKVFPDDGLYGIGEFGSPDDFLQSQLDGTNLGRVEMILEGRRLEGPCGERILAALQFAGAHGGFGSIRLFEECKWKGFSPIDLGALAKGKHDDRELAAMLAKALDGRVPGRIQHVLE